MYTEIYINADLKEDCPEEVIETLQAMCKFDTLSPWPAEKPDRWRYLFTDGSFYTPLTEVAKITFNETAEQWSILGKGDIKNYCGEIEDFFDWIRPYIDGEYGLFIGYMRHEEDLKPELFFK